MNAIPLVDLAAQQAEISEEVMAGLAEVFATTAFIGGKPVGEFELRLRRGDERGALRRRGQRH